MSFSDEDMIMMFDKYTQIKNTTYDLSLINPFNNKQPKKDDQCVDWCDVCDSNGYLHENTKEGILTCSNCGLVIREIIDESAEWRNYEGDSTNNVRTSGIMHHYLPHTSMKTNIGGHTNSFLKRANTWSNNNYLEKKRMTNMCFITKICRKNDILKCIEDDAIILYCKLSDVKHPFGANKGKNIIMRGTKKTGFIAACLYYSFSKNNNNKTNKEIAAMFDVKVKIVTEGRKKFLSLFNLISYDISTKSSVTEAYIHGFCEKLNVVEKDKIELSLRIAKNMQMIGFLSSHKPISIAAIIIYVVIEKTTGKEIQRKLVSAKLDVSGATLEKLHKIMTEKYEKLIDDDLVMKHKEKLDSIRKNITPPKQLVNLYDSYRKLNPHLFKNIGI